MVSDRPARDPAYRTFSVSEAMAMAMATAAGLSMPDAWVTRGDEAGTLNNLGLALSPRERLTGTFLPLVTPRR